MPDDKLKEVIKDIGKGAEYFGKLKKGRSPQMERMEETVEGPVTLPPPSEPEKKLLKRSTGGSPPFTDREMKQGYRNIGKGMGK